MRLQPCLALLSSFLLTAFVSAQPGGSAFVLDRFGLHVPGNSFERLDAVFFSAGRGVDCLGTALADGDYYFQITDPAGTVLLSTDPILERKVRVAGGVLTQYLGTKHLASAKGPCGSLYLRLYPFLPSPYPSREYRIWLTRVQDYDPLLTNLFGFDPGLCKSDGFRVFAQGPQAILRGHKFFDHDRNGTWNPLVDPLEVPIGGWRVELYKDNVQDGVTFTDQDGWYSFIRDRDGLSYELREVAPGGFVNDNTPGAVWRATTARTGTVNASQEYVSGPEFGNIVYELAPAVGRSLVFWGGGCDPTTGELIDTSEARGLLQQSDPAWRTALRTYDGGPVKLRRPYSTNVGLVSVYKPSPPPEAFADEFDLLQGYLQFEYPVVDHAAYLLSRQVAVALLNNRFGYMQGDILIDRQLDGVLVPLSEMFAGAINLLTSPGAGLTGPNDASQELRHMMLMCTNEFGRINETGEPGAPQVVYRPTEVPPRIATPYVD